MKTFSIAVYDKESDELSHVITKSDDAFSAFQSFHSIWFVIKDTCNDDDEAVPTDIESLQETCSTYGFDVSIIEVE